MNIPTFISIKYANRPCFPLNPCYDWPPPLPHRSVHRVLLQKAAQDLPSSLWLQRKCQEQPPRPQQAACGTQEQCELDQVLVEEEMDYKQAPSKAWTHSRGRKQSDCTSKPLWPQNVICDRDEVVPKAHTHIHPPKGARRPWCPNKPHCTWKRPTTWDWAKHMANHSECIQMHLQQTATRCMQKDGHLVLLFEYNSHGIMVS